MYSKVVHISFFLFLVIFSFYINGSAYISIAKFDIKYVVPFLIIGILSLTLVYKPTFRHLLSIFIVCLPALVMLRDYFTFRSTLLYLDLLQMCLIVIIILSLYPKVISKTKTFTIYDAFYCLFFFTMVFLWASTNNALYLSYIFQAVLTPLALASVIIQTFHKISDYNRVLFALLTVTFLIFILQVIYIGPETFIQTSRNQTWLSSGTSIASGGFIEVGTMQLVLIPIAVIFLHQKSIGSANNIGKFSSLCLSISSWSILALPFILNNRANALLSVFLFYFILMPSYRKQTRRMLNVLLIPTVLFVITELIAVRTFTSNGHSVDVLGISLSNIDYTTLNHIKATLSGFQTISDVNIWTGAGPFRGSISVDRLFEVGNFRNFLIPLVKPLVSYGLIYFTVYLIFSSYFYYISRGSPFRYIAILPFLPILGTSRILDLYVTGKISDDLGFLYMEDATPVAIFGFSMCLIYCHILIMRKN